MWTEREKRENARQIIAGNIVDRDSLGRRLTSEAKERAIEFAVDAWEGNMGNGEASQLGIKHVTSGILKPE